MFTVKAAYSDDFELATTVEAAKEFFSDMKNFARLMPGVSEIHIDNNGIAHWRIEDDVPMVGTSRQKFAVEKTGFRRPRRMVPDKGRDRKSVFCRFSAKAKDVTLVHFSNGRDQTAFRATHTCWRSSRRRRRDDPKVSEYQHFHPAS